MVSPFISFSKIRVPHHRICTAGIAHVKARSLCIRQIPELFLHSCGNMSICRYGGTLTALPLAGYPGSVTRWTGISPPAHKYSRRRPLLQRLFLPASDLPAQGTPFQDLSAIQGSGAVYRYPVPLKCLVYSCLLLYLIFSIYQCEPCAAAIINHFHTMSGFLSPFCKFIYKYACRPSPKRLQTDDCSCESEAIRTVHDRLRYAGHGHISYR